MQQLENSYAVVAEMRTQMKSQHLQDTALRYFLEVVRCGSISEASQRLNVASSAISRQISSLEDMLDTVLFERRPRGMVLSAGGEMLAAHAQKVALEADRVVADLLALKGLRSGRIRVAASEGFGIEFLPRLISAFQKNIRRSSFTSMLRRRRRSHARCAKAMPISVSPLTASRNRTSRSCTSNRDRCCY